MQHLSHQRYKRITAMTKNSFCISHTEDHECLNLHVSRLFLVICKCWCIIGKRIFLLRQFTQSNILYSLSNQAEMKAVLLGFHLYFITYIDFLKHKYKPAALFIAMWYETILSSFLHIVLNMIYRSCYCVYIISSI